MRMPDWWDWENWSEPDEAAAPVGPNQEHLVRWGLTVAACLFLASLCPAGTVPTMLGAFLIMGAWTAAIAAALREEPVDAPHLTLWDEAATLAALGLLAPMVAVLPLP